MHLDLPRRSRSALFLFTAALAPLAAAGCAMDPGAQRADPTAEATATSDAELRRSDFGQARSLAVTDQAGRFQGDLPLFGRAATTFAPGVPLGAFARAGVTEVRRVSWVGDANSYLDVFDRD